MPTKKITDLTQLTDLDATDSFVVNDSGAGADKRVEFSDLQSEVLNGAAIGTSTAITELQVDNLNLNGNTFSSTDTNGNILIQPNGTGATVINESGAASDFRVEGDTDTDLLFVDASTDRVGISTNAPSTTFHVAGSTLLDGAVTINDTGADVDFRVEGDTEQNLLFVDASTDRVGIGTSSPKTKLNVTQGDIQLDNGQMVSFYEGIGIGTQNNGMKGSDADDSLRFLTGATEKISIVSGEIVINDDSGDQDFRVEGNGDTHLIFADAGNDRVGIGTSTPSSLLDVNGDIISRTQRANYSYSGNTAQTYTITFPTNTRHSYLIYLGLGTGDTNTQARYRWRLGVFIPVSSGGTAVWTEIQTGTAATTGTGDFTVAVSGNEDLVITKTAGTVSSSVGMILQVVAGGSWSNLVVS